MDAFAGERWVRCGDVRDRGLGQSAMRRARRSLPVSRSMVASSLVLALTACERGQTMSLSVPSGVAFVAALEVRDGLFSGGSELRAWPKGEAVPLIVGEDSDTLEEVYEPFRVQNGCLQRTPRGRVATAQAYRHLGYPAPNRPADAQP